MSDWFSFWGGEEKSDTSSLGATLDTTKEIKSTIGQLQIAKSAMSAIEGLTGLANISLYKKERDATIKGIENSVLAGQEQIFKELSYNTDQAITYAARGNVSIGSPVIRERMKKGAEEAGYDFAMMRANADIQKINAKMTYSQKRRATLDRAVSGIMDTALTAAMFA